jgi:putative sigma-54 modulation protein
MDVTDRIREYVTKKASRLDRYLNGVEQARIDLAYVKSARSAEDRQVAQITVLGKGVILRSEESADDLFAAFDTALDKIQRRMERYKGKHYRGRGDRRAADDVTPVDVEPVEEDDELEGPVIVRRKRFVITPMDEMEALEQMNMLGHDNFFVFYNANSNGVNVLYRRKDGTYGLIEPQIQ